MSNKKDILRYMCQYQERHDGEAPTMEEIADELRISKSTVFHHLRQMALNGELKTVRHSGESGVKYRVRGRFIPESIIELYLSGKYRQKNTR